MTGDILTQADEKRLARRARGERHRRSKKGIVTTIYGSQKKSSKRRGHPLPNYTLKELRDWMHSQPDFDILYKEWVKSGFDSKKKPSCDRIDDYAPYTIDNIRLVTWEENNNRNYENKINGKNTKQSKSVLQLTLEGIVVGEYHSIHHAWRETGSHYSNISACCHGRLEKTGGFIWRFA